MSKLADSAGLFGPIEERLADGMPAFGTCAGAILLARDVLDGRADQRSFGVIDIGIRRNGYGRQIDSFETDIAIEGLVEPFHAVFIRAPIVESAGVAVTRLSIVDASPVVVSEGSVLASTFHPELTGDDRLHQLFLSMV